MDSDEQAEQTFHRKWHVELTQYTPVADKVSNVDKTALNVRQLLPNTGPTVAPLIETQHWLAGHQQWR